MATNRLEGATAEADADMSATNGAPAAAAAGGGFSVWLPLIVNIVLMPVLAFAMTKYVLVPKMQLSGHAASGGDGKSEHGKGAVNEVTAQLSDKVLVNVNGTGATRFLVAKITLVSTKEGFKDSVTKYDAKLRDMTAGILAAKTIQDLEKPGARNLIRAELISAYNNVLGKASVSDIYLVEFAVQ